MDSLTLYLEEHKHIETKSTHNCCNNKTMTLSDNLLLYVCVNCATVDSGHPHEISYYDKFKNPRIVKTFITYSYKHKNICRLNKWGNYVYAEVQEAKLLKEIQAKLIGYDREIIQYTVALFSILYKDLSIRAKIKDSLIAYCLYSGMLYHKKEVEIDDILKLMNITIKNYLDLNNKLKEDALFYLEEMNTYLKLIDYKITKNDFIRMYSEFSKYNKRKFNNKSILISIIYYVLNKDKNFDKDEFYDTFSISKTSIKNVCLYIEKNKIKI